jgi:hypothetical protein
MKAYNELFKLTENLLNAKDDETKAEAENKLREFTSYDNYHNRKPDIEDAVSILSDAVNVLGGKSIREKFVAKMGEQHRTLQQGMTGLFLLWIKYLGELPENWYDGRNEASVIISRDIIAWMKFTNELKQYHTQDNIDSDSQIKYLESHKAELEEFVAFVRGFVLNKADYITYLPLI